MIRELLPEPTLARAASEQPHPGGPGSAVDPQAHSDPLAPEVRRAPGILVATFQRGYDYAAKGWTLEARPEG